MSDKPVVILTALNLEYLAVRGMLTDLSTYDHQEGTRFERGRVAGGHTPVVLGLTGKGNHSAAVLAERAQAVFDPAAVLFVGVAGALWPTIELGDVVVAAHVYAYHGATSDDDGMKARPRTWAVPHRVDQLAHHVARGTDWTRRLPSGAAVPNVRFGPIAAGEVVQDSAISAHALWIKQHYNDALAIEMEAAGVAEAAHLNSSRPMCVVRGISDRADGSKTHTDGQSWQERAVANAAAFAIALTEEFTASHAASTAPSTNARRPDVTGFGNYAYGNARVGVQAHTINGLHGDVHVGGSEAAPDLTVQLAELRRMLSEARRRGALDEPTAEAAQHELDEAAAAVPPQTEEKKNKVVMALRRLYGLVAEVTELSAHVGTIISAVRGAQ